MMMISIRAVTHLKNINKLRQSLSKIFCKHCIAGNSAYFSGPLSVYIYVAPESAATVRRENATYLYIHYMHTLIDGEIQFMLDTQQHYVFMPIDGCKAVVGAPDCPSS